MKIDVLQGLQVLLVVGILGFLTWAVVEHYRDHHDHDQYREPYQERSGIRIEFGYRNDGHSYYCPRCGKYMRSCPHRHQYDPHWRR